MLDAEFTLGSAAFFNQVRLQRIILVISVTIQEEIAAAPEPVRELFQEFAQAAQIVDVSPDARALQRAYMINGIVPAKYETDALHVALATVARCDAIVSWNFKHIVQMNRIRQYNAVNQLPGYNAIAIHTPREVLSYGD